LEFKGYVRRVMGNVSSTTARLIEGLDGEDAIALLNFPIEIIVGIVLWLPIKQVPDRAIGLHRSAEL
jgi:hypothetical protein